MILKIIKDYKIKRVKKDNQKILLMTEFRVIIN